MMFLREFDHIPANSIQLIENFLIFSHAGRIENPVCRVQRCAKRRWPTAKSVYD